MQDIMEKVTKYTGLLKISSAEVVTPMNIVKDMVDLLPSEIFKPESTFLDPAVKSGRFLIELFNRLMESPAMIEAFPDTEERKKKILTEQLFGLATSETTAAIVRKALYDDPNETGNIRYTADKFSKELIQGAFHIMQFDVVIGNPPYNNDIYIDFVTQGHNLAKQYDVWITPAKWQAKGGKKNEDFRENIVPHMSKIVYYPYTNDVFDITSQGGISYYIIDRHKHNAIVNIKSSKHSFIKNECFTLEGRLTIYDSITEKIVRKVSTLNISGKQLYLIDTGGKHKVKTTHLLCGTVNKINCFGGFIICPMTITDNSLNIQNEFILFSSNNRDECFSFMSYIESKLVRFLILPSISSGSINNKETWRFVPDPGPFDHIFTDAELYKKYNLTDEEINIIESVIKERK